MRKGIERSIQKKMASQLEDMDIDFYDFADMVQSGLQDEEIAKELGIDKKRIQELKNKLFNEFDARW
ncbi:MAG TPA: hypothetical protein GX503_02030 [Clostridiales bacterium]|nr:hypothetical protein [Clostridiales bacterium]